MTVYNTHNETFYNMRIDILICLFLILITFGVYLQVKDHEFIDYDDDKYVTENQYVQKGLTKSSMVWAFKTTFASNWHPLTWMSHMLDIQLYGMKPGAHHMTNVFFHILNSLLIFIVFRRMSGNLWQSAFLAALFSLHPLHVESVAWVAERKDVLSTFFWMLTMYCYIWYVERPCFGRYLPVLLFFIMGLMTKPMLVTLPFVLLLLDYWPLCRFQFKRSDDVTREDPVKPFKLSLLYEKIPLLFFSAASCIVTLLAQQTSGAVGSLYVYPYKDRIANALVSYIGYIGKMILPVKLAVLYPHPDTLPVWKITLACFLLITISILAIKYLREHPWLAVGWLWYLGTLLPVIGLVQVGTQAMADRYTYIPLIGLFIMLGWTFPKFLSKWPYKRIAFISTAGVLLSILTVAAWFQVQYWANSLTLFKHAIEVTDNNYVAHNNLGFALKERGMVNEAVKHYSEALRINPNFEFAHLNMGAVLADQGDNEEAVEHYKEALRIKPDFITARLNIGNVRLRQGRITDAVSEYSKVLDLDPYCATAYNGLGAAMIYTGKIEQAIDLFQKALLLKPDFKSAKKNLEKTLAAMRKL